MKRNKYITINTNVLLQEKKMFIFYSFTTIFFMYLLCATYFSGMNETKSLPYILMGWGGTQIIIRYTGLFQIVTSALRKNKAGWSDRETSLDKGGQEPSL